MGKRCLGLLRLQGTPCAPKHCGDHYSRGWTNYFRRNLPRNICNVDVDVVILRQNPGLKWLLLQTFGSWRKWLEGIRKLDSTCIIDPFVTVGTGEECFRCLGDEFEDVKLPTNHRYKCRVHRPCAHREGSVRGAEEAASPRAAEQPLQHPGRAGSGCRRPDRDVSSGRSPSHGAWNRKIHGNAKVIIAAAEGTEQALCLRCMSGFPLPKGGRVSMFDFADC